MIYHRKLVAGILAALVVFTLAFLSQQVNMI